MQIEAFTVEDLALAVKRQMIGILADQNTGQRARAGAAAFDGAQGQRSLNEPFTAGAGQPGSDDPVHDEALGNVFRLFSHNYPDPAQATAAIGTGIGDGHQFHLHPGDEVRDRAALGFGLLFDVRQLHPYRHRGCGNLAGLQRQLQLLGRRG